MKRKLSGLVLALTLVLSLASTSVLALDADSSEVYQGLDVSIYQGEIDFAEVYAAGYTHVYIRASEGDTYTDQNYAANAEGAQAAGLHFGFYHYFTAESTEDAITQAEHFVQLIESFPYDMRPVMDFESFGRLSHAEANQVALAFLQEVESLTGVTPMVYTYASAASSVFDEALGSYPLWVANFGASEPHVTGNVWSGWAGFQYSSSGSVAGIDTRVDLDRYTPTVMIANRENSGTDAGASPGTNSGSTAGNQTYTQYTVQRGDSLWAISQKFDTTVKELIALNGIKHPNLIYAGEVLNIAPLSEGPTESATTKTHIVVRGDTLSKLARDYHTTVQELARINHIANPNLIHVGEVLVLP